MSHTRSIVVALLSVTAATACEPKNESNELPEIPDRGSFIVVEEPTAVAPEPAKPGAAQAPAAPSAPLDGYVAHEWGLLRYIDGRPAEIGTSYMGRHVTNPKPKIVVPRVPHVRHPRIRRNPPTIKKPLIYLTPDPGFDTSRTIDVTVTLRGGTLREVWPTPALASQPEHGASFTWEKVSLVRDTSCGRLLAPKLEDPACSSLRDGGVCEAAEMRDYLRDVPHCLQVGHHPTPVLLYNGSMPDTPPATLEGTTLTNTSAHTLGPVYVRHGPDHVLVRVDTLLPGARVDVSTIEPLDVGDGPSSPRSHRIKALAMHIHTDLVRIGLNEREAFDFVEAWEPDVLARQGFDVLGFYSAAGVREVATLEMTPAPRELVRAMAFSIERDVDPADVRKRARSTHRAP